MDRFTQLVDSNFLVSRAYDDEEYEQDAKGLADVMLPLEWRGNAGEAQQADKERQRVNATAVRSLVVCCCRESAALARKLVQAHPHAFVHIGDVVSQRAFPTVAVYTAALAADSNRPSDSRSVVLIPDGQVPAERSVMLEQFVHERIELTDVSFTATIGTMSPTQYLLPWEGELICRTLRSSALQEDSALVAALCGSEGQDLDGDRSKLSWSRPLEVPAMLQGTDAAFLSGAEFRGRSAIGYVAIDDPSFRSMQLLAALHEAFCLAVFGRQHALELAKPLLVSVQQSLNSLMANALYL
ncbi:hypothetical protein FVE85_5350 [Porphyridium purpureum]|uniref:Uncharacterized protein n=1 Tax=Porphyridium purpureum TaxID=35688 RepID=A0A5J4Z396_PORPP|nr:hypothetical protein FVE85_5350 [Porphyridium purpureum]|eukprot:POR6027..scf295_1